MKIYLDKLCNLCTRLIESDIATSFLCPLVEARKFFSNRTGDQRNTSEFMTAKRFWSQELILSAPMQTGTKVSFLGFGWFMLIPFRGSLFYSEYVHSEIASDFCLLCLFASVFLQVGVKVMPEVCLLLFPGTAIRKSHAVFPWVLPFGFSPCIFGHNKDRRM